MHSNAMRWLGRLKGPGRVVRASLAHDNSRVACGRLHINLPLSRGLYGSPWFQTNSTPTPSSPESVFSRLTASSASPKPQNLPPKGPRWILLVVIFAASAGTAYLYRRQTASPDDDVINMTTFTAFTITEREQVSPTAFIITLRPSSWVEPEGVKSEHPDDEPAGFVSRRIQEAWRHGLWSVEIKQPQLQIARHYTPLPPLLKTANSPYTEEKSQLVNGNTNGVQAIGAGKMEHSDDEDEQADLRILIRRMDGGEMSNYLSRQRVGDTVWLRGPHLGFDVPRRLGDESGQDDTKIGHARGQRGVVFLAGGTGVAPALQVAHKLLDGQVSSGSGESQPHVSILWANRWGVDALGREQPPSLQRQPNSWFGFWGRGNGNFNLSADLQGNERQLDNTSASSLALQIRDLKRRHPSRFNISYFVDDERSFIKARDIEAALAFTTSPALSHPREPSSSSVSINRSCTWHSSKAVELLPDDNDAARSSSSDPACQCTCASDAGMGTAIARPGVNLVCVSGPDGFIEAYAGAKRWHDGNEMQGAIRGLLGRIQRDKKRASEWLVLKL